MATVAELEAAVIAGDKSIKPADIEKARAAERYAELTAQSDAREAKEAEAAAHQAAVNEFLKDYEEFMTSDLEPLREAYAALVVAVADLHTLLEDHRAKQSQIKARASKLGLHSHPMTGEAMPHHAPVPEDAERWRAQFVYRDVPAREGQKERGYIADAVEEGKRGFLPRRGKVGTHVLHTPERKEELRSLNERGADRKQLGIEMRDRILNEALSGE
ncbi:hypothetical protein IU433_14845 [Nocardia puris]|uniref:hypothetical protein n=1 Tax=Nocardia puris TaxID=208602 RepID=UPI001894F940|nr:hypothetical protein [Nocardia puris]MBF6214632.1 hypothetical protein [Nocardia puris]MBF6366041.1 hypothetical protein [Nocardia puris]MBF6460316.1 hypothetical protein [Nocardia puris]